MGAQRAGWLLIAPLWACSLALAQVQVMYMTDSTVSVLESSEGTQPYVVGFGREGMRPLQGLASSAHVACIQRWFVAPLDVLPAFGALGAAAPCLQSTTSHPRSRTVP